MLVVYLSCLEFVCPWHRSEFTKDSVTPSIRLPRRGHGGNHVSSCCLYKIPFVSRRKLYWTISADVQLWLFPSNLNFIFELFRDGHASTHVMYTAGFLAVCVYKLFIEVWIKTPQMQNDAMYNHLLKAAWCYHKYMGGVQPLCAVRKLGKSFPLGF